MLALLLDTPASRAPFTPDMQSCLVIQDVIYEMPIFSSAVPAGE